MTLLDDILHRVQELPAEEIAKLQAAKARDPVLWLPNPGPQQEAHDCLADELFYGGQAGGGKTFLALGLSVTAHKRSLLLRRINKDAIKLVDHLADIYGHRDGYNGQYQSWKIDGRQIDIGGCERETDKQRYKGEPHSLICFDEISDFLESQYRFIVGWNRSSDPQERCRVVAAGNPPTTPEGLWVLKYWGPWLDPNHPKPANPGELRWFTTINGADAEVDGPGPHLIDGANIIARSRTFIRASLDDNPDLARTNYGSVLAALPEELRAAYLEGRFDASLRDHGKQVIPTAWIEAAQARWTPDGFKAFAMTAMAVDPAGGGADAMEICWRHGGWYAPLVTVKGPETADGSASAAQVMRYRRDACPVIVDSGGGYGGSISLRLKDNGVATVAFNGAGASTAVTRDDAKLRFANKRAEATWRFREELNPDQQGGSTICLPPDAELKADLASLRWDLSARGIQIESKDDIRTRLARSPGKGDACIYCLSEGNTAIRRLYSHGNAPKVLTAYSKVKRRH